VSLTGSFRGSKVRQKKIFEISNIYKNSHNALKIKKLPSKNVLSHEHRWKNALFIAKNVILRFFFAQDQNFSKFHKTYKKNVWPKQKNRCLIIFNDKPNCQVSRILMNPRPIYLNCSENDSLLI
jgi:hypothetical protein